MRLIASSFFSIALHQRMSLKMPQLMVNTELKTINGLEAKLNAVYSHNK